MVVSHVNYANQGCDQSWLLEYCLLPALLSWPQPTEKGEDRLSLIRSSDSDVSQSKDAALRAHTVKQKSQLSVSGSAILAILVSIRYQMNTALELQTQIHFTWSVWSLNFFHFSFCLSLVNYEFDQTKIKYLKKIKCFLFTINNNTKQLYSI